MDQRFGKALRLRSARQFTTVIHEGSFASDDTLVLYVKRSPEADSLRLGITIPKKVGNAVARNRWKRLIREAFRTQRDRFPIGYDFVVRPKKGAFPDFHAIAASLVRLSGYAVGRERRRR